LDLALAPGVVLVVGPNGAGKTNLLESLHVGTQGFSPRTRDDVALIRFGAEGARVSLEGMRGTVPLSVSLVLRHQKAKEARVNGAPLRAAEQLRSEVTTLVFTPDRLAVVKSGPAARRAYFDRALGRLAPARAGLPAEYGAAVAQRNASLRRVSMGISTRDALAPWTERVAELGARLVEARYETLAALAPGFADATTAFGLDAGRLDYQGEQPTRDALEARVDRDVDRGTTSIGPHLDDIGVLAGSRDLRGFGSQGEQRLAVLSLLLAEAELIADRRGTPPLLLLDDVLSELDPGRREALVERVARLGQTVITSTDASTLPVEPAQLVTVSPGLAA
jgi:DNA replication and repair protein RecF